MTEIMQFLEAMFTPLVFIFTVTNLFNLGLQVKLPNLAALIIPLNKHLIMWCLVVEYQGDNYGNV